MNLRSRFFTAALAAPCFWLAGCGAAADDADDVAPAQEEEAVAEAEEVDVAGVDADEAAERGAPIEAGATAAGDQCSISGFPKPWGSRAWGSVSIALFSNANETCWFTTVTSPSRLNLCAWVDMPIIGNRGKVCASSAYTVTSHNVIGVSVPIARGTMAGFPIWYDP
jgi:hypothetical protein